MCHSGRAGPGQWNSIWPEPRGSICGQVQVCEADGCSQKEGYGGDDPGGGHSGRGLADSRSAVELLQEVDPCRLPGEAARGYEIVHKAAGQVDEKYIPDGHLVVELEDYRPPGQSIE